jgi:hypothetical protein
LWISKPYYIPSKEAVNAPLSSGSKQAMLLIIATMKIQILCSLLLLSPALVYADTDLDNSLWGKAARHAGLNVTTLYSMALHESGMRWPDGTFRPWPWTLYVNTENKAIKKGPRRYENRAAAEQGLTQLIRQGITNIDIGLMQVNYYWHRDKVRHALELLEPRTNLLVAANFLKTLKQNNNHHKTIARYHSQNEQRGANYVEHVKRYEKIIQDQL